MATFVFYCNDTLSNISKMEYYRLDIDALEKLGHEVIVCNRYRDIPYNFDAIYIYWWTYALAPVLFARLTGRRAFVSGVFNYQFPESLKLQDYVSRPVWQQCLMRWAMKLATHNLLTSLSDFKRCKEAFGIKNLTYTPCCVGDEYFQVKMSKDPAKLLNIAWAGFDNLVRKGVFDIIDALRLVKKHGCAFEMYMAGGAGDGSKALQQAIESAGLVDEVHLKGEVSREEKLKLLGECGIYVQPSNYEGFGLASAEAMAAGLAVLSCDVGDVRNTLGDYAVYVESGNASSIATELIDLIEAPRDAEQVSFARDFIAAKYSYSRKIEDIGAVLAL